MFNALFTKTDEYARLAQALGGPGACALFGIPGSGRAMVYAALAKALDKPLCIVTPREAEATRFAGDLNALGVAAAVFPARDYVLRPIEGTGREYEYRRLAVLGDLVGGRLQAVCVPDEGLTQYTTPRADFCANTRSLRPGDTLPRAELTALLYGAGYTRRDQVDGPGQFSIRGDIADIYAPDMKQPARMEFWGDEIDTIFAFVFEAPSPDQFRAAAVSIAYCGIMSSGVAYTLQIVGQKELDPTIASLAMCLESVFSALAGWLILGETLSATELCGCALMFGAIVVSQLPEKKRG